MVRRHNYAQGARSESSSTFPMRYRIRAEAGATRIDILDDIGGDPWGGGLSAKSLSEQLAGARGPLAVHVSSSGGDVFDGLAMAEAIRAYPGRVTTYVDGLAASIASVIVQAGQQRVMAQGSLMMLHDAWTVAAGNGEELRRQSDLLDKVSDNLARQYADRAGGTPGYWRGVMKAETWYTADEAVSAGLADRVGSGTAAPLPGAAVEPLAARAPARIAARLRVMAAASTGGDQDGETTCLTCNGSGRLKHPGTGKLSKKCPSCDGAGTFPPLDDDGAQARGMDVETAREAIRQLRAILPPLTTREKR